MPSDKTIYTTMDITPETFFLVNGHDLGNLHPDDIAILSKSPASLSALNQFITACKNEGPVTQSSSLRVVR